MKIKPIISIIVTVYRVEAYLEKCVRSLMGQTLRDIQIVLVDDGSPDGCPALCEAYAAEDSRIVVIHRENAGPSAARNSGLQVAEGKYILFVDGDDYIDLDACERLLPFLERDCDVVIADGVSEGGTKRLRHGNFPVGEIVDGKEYLNIAVRRNAMPMVVWLYVYKREFLMQNALFLKVGVIHEDEHYIPRVFLKAQSVVESGVRFYHYVIHEGSITMKKDLRKNAEDLYVVCTELEEIYMGLEDEDLKRLLVDSLSIKYLSLLQQGKIYQYGKSYIHKEFLIRCARRIKTKTKVAFFCLSPSLYWYVNNSAKCIFQKLRNKH